MDKEGTKVSSKLRYGTSQYFLKLKNAKLYVISKTKLRAQFNPLIKMKSCYQEIKGEIKLSPQYKKTDENVLKTKEV